MYRMCRVPSYSPRMLDWLRENYDCLTRLSAKLFSERRPQFSREHPLNLSILLSGGKETNEDSPSNGE